MDLNSILVSEFAKITNDNKETVNEGATVYGTYRVDGDGAYVQIDGSDTRTPVATTSEARNGDRVTVLIKNHRAIITGNLTDPSTTVKSVEERIATGVGDIQKTIDNLKTQLDNQEITLDDYRKAIAEAKRMATDYINFTAGTGLVIGSSAISSNVRIYSGGIDIRDKDKILASYTDDAIYLGYNNIASKISMCANRFNITAGHAFSLNPEHGTETILESTETCLTLQNGSTWIGILNDSGTSPFGGNIYVSGDMEIGGIICNDIVNYEGYEYITYIDGFRYYADIDHEHSGYYKSGSDINVREIKSSYTYGDTVDYSTNMYIGNTGLLHRTTKTSSRTVKHDIKPIENSDILPEKLYDVDVIQFVYNEGQLGHSSKRYGKELPGFIVEDLVEKYPIAVDIDEEDKPFQWNEQYLIPPMLALIQQQKKKLDELESRIEALEKKEV